VIRIVSCGLRCRSWRVRWLMRWRCWWSGVWWPIRVLGLLLVAVAWVGMILPAGPAVPVGLVGLVRTAVFRMGMGPTVLGPVLPGLGPLGLVLWMLVM